jgi:hypothetical protein
MAYNNVLPAHLVAAYLQNNPAQKRKEIENPRVNIPEHLVTDCLIRYDFEGHYGVTAAHKDHPAFDEVRHLLKARGYISIPEYPCWNGDRVLKRFQFNGFQLEPGDVFYCAAAWAGKIAMRAKKGIIA